MNGSTPGLWDIADATLRWIGKGVAWLVRRKNGMGEEYAAYAMIGGALLCAAFGAVVGYAVSDISHSFAIEGAMIGGLLGMCIGIFFGATVDAVDSSIQAKLRSLNSIDKSCKL